MMQSCILPLRAGMKNKRVARRRLSWALPVIFLLVSLNAQSLLAQQNEDQEQSARTESAPSFRISGTVTSADINEQPNAVRVGLRLNLVAENTGQENLIILRRAPTPNAEYVFTSPTAAEPLWVLSHPTPINEVPPNHKKDTLRTEIDQKEPPDDATIVLNPGDTIGWDISLELMFAKVAEPRDVQVGKPPRPVWDIVKKSCPCWLKLDLDLWPISIESKRDSENPALARKLSARWKKAGKLVYVEKRTEAIPLTLQTARR